MIAWRLPDSVYGVFTPLAPVAIGLHCPPMEEDKPPHAAAPKAALQGRAGLPHRILVVDDDDSVRELNARVLALSGYHVDDRR
jgi:hypothetical protein